MTDTRVPVRVLITIGDQAELITPTRTADNPLRVPAAAISADTGIPIERLAGKKLTAIVAENPQDGMTARAYQLA